MADQLSLFSAQALPPSTGDLHGLLVGPGQVVRRGDAARVSVLVPPAETWRVDALVDGLEVLGFEAQTATSDQGMVVVRTAFSPALLQLADAWFRGAIKTAPLRLALDGPRLRWWCLAAG